MGTLDLGAPPPRRRGETCHVARMLNKHPKDAARLREYLADLDWNGQALATALTEKGYTITASSILRHRRGLCACPKDPT